MIKTNLVSLLNGLVLGEKQEVGVMTVIPLLDPNEGDSPVAEFSDLEFQGTVSYGSFQFRLDGDKPFVLPAGYTVITKQSAQDHGTPMAHILSPGTSRVNYACCVEQSQPGMINPNDDIDFNLMPIRLRKNHFNQLIKTTSTKHPFDGAVASFSRLWPIISEFQKEMVGKNEAHLVYFFTKFVDQLNQFNAEFEAVKSQRGAIILINNQVVGLEIAPSSAYWKVIWDKLIRDCYGSEVVYRAFKKLIPAFKDKADRTVDFTGVTSIEDIRAAMNANSESYNEKILDSLVEVLTAEQKEYKFNGNLNDQLDYSIAGLGGDKFSEVISDKEGNVVYASVLL